ncbi:MAG: hypothetical protein M0T83_05850 [Nitrospiraceae bacterium]|nr:hypothetical protein [Nitrospiraceae bacterium]
MAGNLLGGTPIETEEDLTEARRLGVSLVRGYFMGRPFPTFS